MALGEHLIPRVEVITENLEVARRSPARNEDSAHCCIA